MTFTEFIKNNAVFISLPLALISLSIAVIRFKYDEWFKLRKAKKTITEYKRALKEIDSNIILMKEYNDSPAKFLYDVLERFMPIIMAFISASFLFSFGIVKYIDTATYLGTEFPTGYAIISSIFLLTSQMLLLYTIFPILKLWMFIKDVRNPAILAIEGGRLLNAALEKKYINNEEREVKLKALLDKEIFDDRSKEAIKMIVDRELVKL